MYRDWRTKYCTSIQKNLSCYNYDLRDYPRLWCQIDHQGGELMEKGPCRSLRGRSHMIGDGGKGVGETNQQVEGREGRRMGWQWGGVQREGRSAGMHGGSMWWEVVRQGGGAGKYAGMLNATRWHRRRQEDDCVEGWWVKEELVRSRLMRLMQAGAAGSRAVHAHEGRGEG